MKKYLMTGIAAIAICAAFTSCSKEIEPLTQEQLNEQKALEITNAYNQAFIKTFGQPAANQTWGFGSTTRGITRGSINVNGNMWDTCPEVDTPDEVNAIFNYVNYTLDQMDNEVHHKYSKTAPDNLDGYFVTQVRNGKNTDNNYINTYNNNAAVNAVGGYMNHLQIAFNENPSLDDLNNSAQYYPWGASGWTHINNFNASDNANYGGNTKVENAGAYDFAYHNSLDSKYHNTWILIDGADITSDGKYKDYLYVCFDFESTPQCTTRFRFNYNGQEYGPVDAAGAWKVADAIDSHLKVNLNGTEVDLATVSNLRIDNIIDGDKWVPGDTKYTDWIVRITKGKPADPGYDGRIMAEDLNAKEGSDFDFNDVVFDWKIIDGGAQAEIHLLAAGGTMPLRIGGTLENENSGVEVHKKFDVDVTIMVNTATDGTPRVVQKPYQTFTITAAEAKVEEGVFLEDGSNIPIYVKKDGVWVELTAKRGVPASKINCPTTTKWVDEYAKITWAYPDFAKWVSNVDIDWWENVNPTFVNLLLSDNEPHPAD